MVALGMRCQYPACRAIAAAVVEVIRDRSTIRRRLCGDHVRHAQEMALRHAGIAYRLAPFRAAAGSATPGPFFAATPLV